MKKWIKYIWLAVMCIVLTGCTTKETGSELLNETKEAVEPVKEAVEPVVKETVDGIALHVYCGDDHAENVVQTTAYVDEVSEQIVMEELKKVLGMDENIRLNSISFGMHGGDKVVMLDLNKAFSDYVNRMGTAGEYIVMGSLTNTFLDCYQCELLLVTVDGKVLETGHSIFEEYLEMYPFVEDAYQIRTELLTENGVNISCPQIEGLNDERLQEKWNKRMLKNEQIAMDAWDGKGTYEVTYTVKTMTADVLSILMDGYVNREGAAHPYTFKYTYNIDLHTGASIRLKDHVDVEKVAEHMFAGTGYYVDETLAPYFIERIESIYESPDALARSLEGYDFSDEGGAPYGYSYLNNGKVWICMEVPHSLGDYIEIELDTQ